MTHVDHTRLKVAMDAITTWFSESAYRQMSEHQKRALASRLIAVLYEHDQQAKPSGDTAASLPAWTEGVCGDAVIILRDGASVSIGGILDTLNRYEVLRAAARDTTGQADAEFWFAKWGATARESIALKSRLAEIGRRSSIHWDSAAPIRSELRIIHDLAACPFYDTPEPTPTPEAAVAIDARTQAVRERDEAAARLAEIAEITAVSEPTRGPWRRVLDLVTLPLADAQDPVLINRVEMTAATAHSYFTGGDMSKINEQWSAADDSTRAKWRNTMDFVLRFAGPDSIVADAAGERIGLSGDETEPSPIDMVLHCPACGLKHVDAPEGGWTNPPHRSHLCRVQDGGCGHIWRPADVPTNGVAAVRTRGTHDGEIVEPGTRASTIDPRRALDVMLGTVREMDAPSPAISSTSEVYHFQKDSTSSLSAVAAPPTLATAADMARAQYVTAPLHLGVPFTREKDEALRSALISLMRIAVAYLPTTYQIDLELTHRAAFPPEREGGGE